MRFEEFMLPSAFRRGLNGTQEDVMWGLVSAVAEADGISQDHIGLFVKALLESPECCQVIGRVAVIGAKGSNDKAAVAGTIGFCNPSLKFDNGVLQSEVDVVVVLLGDLDRPQCFALAQRTVTQSLSDPAKRGQLEKLCPFSAIPAIFST